MDEPAGAHGIVDVLLGARLPLRLSVFTGLFPRGRVDGDVAARSLHACSSASSTEHRILSAATAGHTAFSPFWIQYLSVSGDGESNSRT